MSISASPVQQKVSDAWTSGASFTISGLTAPTNGNALVLYFDAVGTTNAVSSITQTGATWFNAVISNTNRRSEIWYALNVASAGTTITVNLSYTPALAGSQSAEVSEWSGIALTSALDATGANAGSSTTPTTASITPTAGRNVLVIGTSRVGGAVSAGPTNGFTALTASDVRSVGGYLVVASASGSYSTGWTAGSGTWATAIASFLAPASAVKPPPAALFQFTNR